MARQIDAETAPSLLMRLRDHQDGSAWRSFVDVYSPLIYRFCRVRKLQASDAADVTQEVLMRVARAIESFEYDRRQGLFRDWLAKIVLNEIRRNAEKKTNNVNGSDVRIALENAEGTAQSESDWNDHFCQHLFDVALEKCKIHFSEDTWILFQKSWLQKESASAVANELQVGVDKVYVARSRVLKRLRYEVSILADDIV